MDKTRTMITFKRGGRKFTYRIAGIVQHEEHILFQRAMNDPHDIFWFLPGGRAELGEDARSTLSREMQEELGEQAHVENLVYVIENFFREHRTSYHELGFYFAMTLPPGSPILQERGPFKRYDEDGSSIYFEWLPVSQLSHLAIFPQVLRDNLQHLPEHTTHILQKHKRFS
jgi:ADP-ribose pyrophosphatase YjhB (NUDIX family)